MECNIKIEVVKCVVRSDCFTICYKLYVDGDMIKDTKYVEVKDIYSIPSFRRLLKNGYAYEVILKEQCSVMFNKKR